MKFIKSLNVTLGSSGPVSLILCSLTQPLWVEPWGGRKVGPVIRHPCFESNPTPHS